LDLEAPIPSDYQSIGFGHTNRGPAVLDDKLYVATLDGYLVALDLKSGVERWPSKVLDYKLGYSMTMAPLAIDGKVVVGVSGGEAGIRGFIDAYYAKSGAQAWRFWTIPGPSEPGHETWSGDAWKTGGGATWVTGAYDPELKLVYWGVGNPGPDWNGDVRPGDNLYTCSLVALDADTGKLRWYFQFSPHDTHDWDATHVPMLFDGQIGGKPRKLIAVANRNAFYYVLDRATGEFLVGKPYAKQTWATGLDAMGRPIPAANAEPSKEGTLIWPNSNGSTVWFSHSYNPQTGLVYVATREIGARYFKRDTPYKLGTFFPGGGEDESPPDDAWGAIANCVTSTRLTYAQNCNDWSDAPIPAGELRKEMQNSPRANRGHGFRRRNQAPSAQIGSRRSLTHSQFCLSKTSVATRRMNTSVTESRAVLSIFSQPSQNYESWPRARYCTTKAEE
jgi:alcohol dehydrogenase (cytochrome c)